MHLRAIASAQPDWVVDNPTIAEWSGLTADFIGEKIGVRRRAFLRHDRGGVALARQACERLFNENPALDRSRVGLVVFVTQNPDYKLPHNSALLQDALKLPNHTAAFDINLGCSGYVYALSVAKGMMASEDIAEAIIVTCDPYSKIMDRANRDVIGLFGDAATATWLSSADGGRIGRGDYGTDGAGCQHLIVRSGGAVEPLTHLDGAPRAETATGGKHLHMNGRAIFNFMMSRVPATVDECLRRNALERSDVDYFVFHQASAFLLATLAERMKLPKAKVPVALADRGNTVSSRDRGQDLSGVRLRCRPFLGEQHHQIRKPVMQQNEAIQLIGDAIEKVIQKRVEITVATDLVGDKILDSLDGMVFAMELEILSGRKFPEEIDLVEQGYFKIAKLVEFLSAP